MNKSQIFLIVFCFYKAFTYAQDKAIDTIKIVNLNEIIVIGREDINSQKQVKPLSSIDEYLEKSNKVTMIKRGNYAWEPTINNMVTERIVVTIDGMQIFGACTDKMDPITSYVDVSNLSEVHVKSGQQGSEYGSTIGGGIDLKLQNNGFEKESWVIGVDTGFESNGNEKVFSSEFNFSNNIFFTNSDVIFRKSDNYFAGGNKEVLFSQYEKYNISSVIGFKTSKNGAVMASIIYDKASDVGYPALTMDVSLAEALITSVSYEHKDLSEYINKWESKLYYNSITHVMDDTKRPSVPIHMDMPGWSDTFGFYSKMYMQKSMHKLLFNANAYYNNSLAEMTMYPNDPNENIMFMLTWPDVRTFNSGIFGEDILTIDENKKLKMNARLGYQHEKIASEFGLNSLKIFYPELDDTNNKFLINISAQYELNMQKINMLFGIGYGTRASSVTEAYGFYLYNSFDNFDYIGNPYLGNEKSIELNTGFNCTFNNKFRIGVDASLFYISDYIIGEIDPDLNEMTIGAQGVKVYTSLKYSTILNSNLTTSYKFAPSFTWTGYLGYNLGKDHEGNNLPLISPFNYKTTIHYKKNLFDAEINLVGASDQNNYSSEYGEIMAEAYTVFNANLGYSAYFGSQKLFVKTGIENIFDLYYSTYADWNNIPRMGRNVFINISYLIK